MRRDILAALLVALLLPAALFAQEADTPQPLVDVRFEGLDRYDHADIVRFSGLEIGEPVTAAGLNALAQQLADTGLFTGIRYQYTTTEKGLSARFTVNESRWTVPVVFDNFIGLGDEQLIEAVSRYVPSFDGTAVEGGLANNLIGTALQRVLADLGRPGRIVVIPHVNIEEGWTRYAFAVVDTGRDMTVCALDLPGAAARHARGLERYLADLRGEPYSRARLQALTEGPLLDYYRRRGYWGASFEAPEAAFDDGCGGISVRLGVAEGIVYRVAGVRWVGNAALPADTLDDAMDLDTGVIANAIDVQDGLFGVRQAYERVGHILVQQQVDHELDPAAERVTFVVTVDEGPQLRMGTFEVEGLPDPIADELESRWRLAEGSVFDGTYPQRFMTDERARIQRDDQPFMTIEVVVDRSAGLAHVKLLPAR